MLQWEALRVTRPEATALHSPGSVWPRWEEEACPLSHTDGDLLGEGARESEREIKRGLEKAGHCHDILFSQTSEQSNLPQQAGVPIHRLVPKPTFFLLPGRMKNKGGNHRLRVQGCSSKKHSLFKPSGPMLVDREAER